MLGSENEIKIKFIRTIFQFNQNRRKHDDFMFHLILIQLDFFFQFSKNWVGSVSKKKNKQVAQRATIAHLTASHQNILNSSHRFFKLVKAANSTVHGWMQPNFKLIRDYIVVLVTCKNEENPIKIEGARVLTRLLFDFSDAQGQLTLKSGVEFRRISNSSKLL